MVKGSPAFLTTSRQRGQGRCMPFYRTAVEICGSVQKEMVYIKRRRLIKRKRSIISYIIFQTKQMQITLVYPAMIFMHCLKTGGHASGSVHLTKASFRCRALPIPYNLCRVVMPLEIIPGKHLTRSGIWRWIPPVISGLAQRMDYCYWMLTTVIHRYTGTH